MTSHELGEDVHQGAEVFILGCRGLIGATLTRDLLESGHRVLGLDNDRAFQHADEWRRASLNWRRDLTAGSTQLLGDVRDTELVRRLLRDHQPKVVVFLSALLASEARMNPQEAEEVQVIAFASLVNACQQLVPRVRLVMASSSYVYGDFEDSVAREDRRHAPVDVYGRCKSKAELLLKESSLDWTVLRPAAVYGIGDPRDRFVSTAIERAARGLEVVIDYPDFAAAFTHVNDVSAAFVASIRSPSASRRAFNVSTEETTTNAAVEPILRRLDPQVRLRRATGEIPSYVPRRGTINCELAHRLLRWQPRIQFEEGVASEFNLAREIEGIK